MSTNNIFISYRHDEAEGHAGRLYDRLNRRFPGRVFMDVTKVSAGEEFSEVIEDKIGSSSVVIVLMGRQWATLTDDYGERRLERTEDYVRQEIVTAMRRKIPLIPVLVGGGRMPPSDLLPPDLVPLTHRNACELTDSDFDYDVQRLIKAIEHYTHDTPVGMPENAFSSAPSSQSPLDPDSGNPNPFATATEPQSEVEGELVFVCYAREDQEFTLKLAQTLKDKGVRVWIDQWDILTSADWDRSIDEALINCDRFLIVLSPSAVDSNEVRTELRTALDEKKCIVPVLFQKCRVPRSLRLTQHVDFTSVAPDDPGVTAQLLRGLTAPK